MWYLLKSLVSAGACLESLKVYHGNLIPLQVCITKNGQVKIADHGLVAYACQRTSLDYFLNNEYDDCYLSPEQLLACAQHSPFPPQDFLKADVFSLGMTLLYCANLLNPKKCYEYSRFKLISKKLDELVFRASNRYSPQYIDVLKSMLNLDPRCRPSFSQLVSSLKIPISPTSQVFSLSRPLIALGYFWSCSSAQQSAFFYHSAFTAPYTICSFPTNYFFCFITKVCSSSSYFPSSNSVF